MSDQVHYHRGVNRSETLVFEEPCGPQDSIPETLIPKGNKSRVSGVGVEAIFTSPASTIPEEVKAGIREHKPAILARLHRVWDGQAPPLGRAPRTEEELRRLKDYWEEPWGV